MFKVATTLLLLFLQQELVVCYIKSNVQGKPRPMPNLILEKIGGRWYNLARYIPCGFQGSREFTDLERENIIGTGDPFYKVRLDYRVNGKCYHFEDKRIVDGNNCGRQIVKDNIGKLYNGERIIVATDYKRFLIEWGCLKYAQDEPNICNDLTMNIFTRTRNPSPRTRLIVDLVLKKLFNITISDLDIQVLTDSGSCTSEKYLR